MICKLKYIIHLVNFLIILHNGQLIAGDEVSVKEELILISSFSVSINKHDPNVKENLYLALEKMKGKEISATGIISFNEIVGEGSLKNGFKPASVYFAEETVSEPGGGLCIAATTLFNALSGAGFEIKERHKHSRPITYAPPGLDATISYGKLDLKLINPHKQSFVIDGNITESSFMIKIYSKKELNYQYELRAVVQTESASLENEESFKPAIHVVVYRDKFKDNKILESRYLYTDYIRATIKN